MVDWIRLNTFLTSDELFMNRNATARLNSWRRRKYQNIQVTDKSSIDELQFDRQSTVASCQGFPNRRGGGYCAPAEVTAIFILPYPRGKPGNRARPLNKKAAAGGFQGKLQKILRTSLAKAFLGHTMWPTQIYKKLGPPWPGPIRWSPCNGRVVKCICKLILPKLNCKCFCYMGALPGLTWKDDLSLSLVMI
uniref:Uncharacterized protein n=1 Tax=Oryza rufipogon TaxID=4529 RepID=A0A0E0RIY6_ORYRU